MDTTNATWKRSRIKRWVGAPIGLALAAAGLLFCGGDAPVDAVYASAACTDAQPGAGDYCAWYNCGPCVEGEGDCDPGQCAAGLECVEEGAVDHCRDVDSCNAYPGTGDYCAECGPCGEGEGDCDPGQCASGLTCVEEGDIDHCRDIDDGCDSNPGAGDYCAVCGPCGEGEGDCDPGQCGSGLECVEEGSVDRCRPVDSGSGSSNFQVKVDGAWRGICCVGGIPQLSDKDCFWTEYDRILKDKTAGLELDCPEGGPTSCKCDGSGERMHSTGGAHVGKSLDATNGGPIYSNYATETCVYVKSDGKLATKWSDSSCPSFRLE